MTDLHSCLMALVVLLRLNGQDEEATWIARQVAEEQEAEVRRRGAKRRRKVKVRVVGRHGAGSTAWIDQDRLKGQEGER